jgi:hypothetical protein
MTSPAQTLGTWVLLSLKAYVCVCAYSVLVLTSVGTIIRFVTLEENLNVKGHGTCSIKGEESKNIIFVFSLYRNCRYNFACGSILV